MTTHTHTHHLAIMSTEREIAKQVEIKRLKRRYVYNKRYNNMIIINLWVEGSERNKWIIKN